MHRWCHPENIQIMLQIAEFGCCLFFCTHQTKKKNPQKAELNPSACEASNDGGDKSEHPFEQLIMAEQRKVINV